MRASTDRLYLALVWRLDILNDRCTNLILAPLIIELMTKLSLRNLSRNAYVAPMIVRDEGEAVGVEQRVNL